MSLSDAVAIPRTATGQIAALVERIEYLQVTMIGKTIEEGTRATLAHIASNIIVIRFFEFLHLNFERRFGECDDRTDGAG